MAKKKIEWLHKDVDFSLALKFAKLGHRITRRNWTEKGSYLYIVPAANYPAQTKAAKEEFGKKVPYEAYWALRTADGTVVT